jgi:hypothetical protein
MMPTGRRLARQVARDALPSSSLHATRLPGRPFVFVGIDGHGYVRLTPAEARRFLAELERVMEPPTGDMRT